MLKESWGKKSREERKEERMEGRETFHRLGNISNSPGKCTQLHFSVTWALRISDFLKIVFHGP